MSTTIIFHEKKSFVTMDFCYCMMEDFNPKRKIKISYIPPTLCNNND